ncbi:inositol monophosphatase family protein [Nocardia caishijiensis]|uniref:Myo-inositol-1(Or 4)-monophosphatase n=1 Tax=Nocardia caishijiensis TaxID=184756 RepID=A0ABQ6YPU5_9NOCA|nr:inositol monophosphatase family protein [Nocardia caishijiensis]KAF0847534.1 myo-inositol-1(or 4)-monophosphatase [Nocardia caishijiensis]
MHHSDVDIAIRATELASQVIRSSFHAPVTRYAKQGDDFATQTDLAAERAILEVLASARPHDRFVAEESGTTGAPDSDRTWFVDPLCGTRNFAVGTQLVAVNVALRVGDTVRVAAVGAPFTGEVFWTSGEDAFRRHDGHDTVLRPDAGSRLIDVDLDNPLPWSRPTQLLDRLAADFHPRVLSTSLALVWVAAGRRAAYVAGGDHRDDVHFTSAVAVCRAAGCVVTGIAGQPLHSAPHGLLAAADADTHARLVEAVLALR